MVDALQGTGRDRPTSRGRSERPGDRTPRPAVSENQEAMSTDETSRQESDAPTADLPPARDLAVADTGAGLLVYEREREYRSHLGRETEIARRLIGFADVTDWDVIAEAVRARGGGHGDVLHLPEFDLEEVPEGEA